MNTTEKECLKLFSDYEKAYGNWLTAQCKANDASGYSWECVQARPVDATEGWESSVLVPAQEAAAAAEKEADTLQTVAQDALKRFLEVAKAGGIRVTKSRKRLVDKWADTAYYLVHTPEEDTPTEYYWWKKHRLAYRRCAKKFGSRLVARAAFKAWIEPYW